MISRLARLAFFLVAACGLMSAAGCASAYHDYRDCGINCRYCPPPPLAYTPYCGCACHSSAATQAMAATASTEASP